MVMQARKRPRLSDGYFDRNQGNSFESKFAKSNEYSGEKLTNSSNSDSSRNDLNDSRCHRPSQRLKDHHEDTNKSPITKNDKAGNKSSFDGPSDRYHSNHDRNSQEELEKRLPVIDWSEHMSSTGKKYYYNCKTEISQWEKPKELVEWERQQNLSRLTYDPNRCKEKPYEKNASSSGSRNCHTDETPVENHCEAKVGLLSPSQVTLANLPKLIKQLAGIKAFAHLTQVSPEEALRSIEQALQITQKVTNKSQIANDAQNLSRPSASPAQNHHQPAPVTSTAGNSTVVTQQQQPLPTSAANNSLPADFLDLDEEPASPVSDCSTHSIRHDSPSPGVSSGLPILSGASSTLKSSSAPSLTPSLANNYREDLISHVTGWQADHADRQANRYSDEAYQIASLHTTQVTAELKSVRALVRLEEVHSILKDQRILFLNQQIKEMEEWKSLNSYMLDS